MIRNSNIENIDNLILAFLQGTMSPEEKIEFKSWLASDEKNKAEFRRIYTIWKAASISNFDGNQIQTAFERVQLHTVRESATHHSSSRPSRQLTTRFLPATRRWAAILIGIVALSGLFYLINTKPSEQDSLLAKNVISVPLGSKSKIILPDGTEVWLNAGSKLTYNMNYGLKTREVNLTGEGYFNVTKQEKKPFIVHTVKANIKALGTEFNVKAYPDEAFIETILVKGSIAVNQVNGVKRTLSNTDGLILKPGQKARISKTIETKDRKVEIPVIAEQIAKQEAITNPVEPSKDIYLQASDTEVETSWKDDRWIIKGEKMDVLSVLLARRFNVSIALKSEALLKYKFSGTIQNETLEQVFKIMSLTTPISYTIDKGKVTLDFNTKFEEKYKAAYKKESNKNE